MLGIGNMSAKNSNVDVGDSDSVSVSVGMCMNPEKNGVELEREMEKSKMREEIIASEMAGTRELEEDEEEHEVRRDLMMMKEKQILVGTEMKLTTCPSLGSHQHLPSENSNMIGIGIEGKQQQQQMEEEAALGKRPSDSDQTCYVAHQLMSEAAPSASIIGVKRKAEMPCDEEITPTATMSKDSEKFCSLCGVSTTSEVTMNSHLQGRKHKAKEAMFKAKDTVSPLQTLNTFSSKQENSSDTKKWECSLCRVSVSCEALLTSHLQGKKHKAKEAKLQSVEMIDKMEGFPFEKSQGMSVPSSCGNDTDATDKHWYCSLCGVSASSENNLNDHLQGKKHKAKAAESMKKVSEIGVVSDKSLNEEDIPKKEVTVDNPISEDRKDEEIGVGSKEEGIPEEVGEIDFGDEKVELEKLWHCKMCNTGTRDEATMAAHRKSDEHMTLLKKHGGGLITVKSVKAGGGISHERPCAS